MTKQSNNSQKILGLTISNFKKIKAFNVDLENKNLVVVSGKNESGKTSIIDAIHSALAGKQYFKKQIQEVIKRGQDQADVTIETDKFIIHRYWNQSGNDYIKIQDREGIPQGKEETLLSRFYSEYSRDPHRMVNMDEKEQVEFMFRLLGLTDTLEQLELEKKEQFEKRTEVNREVKSLKSTLNLLPEFDEIPEVPSTKELMDQLDNIESQNKAITDVGKMIDDQKEEIDTTASEIKELQDQIQELQNSLKDKKSDYDEQRQIMKELKEEHQQLSEEWVDPAPTKEKLANVEQLQETRRQATEYFEKKGQLESKSVESDSLTDTIKMIEAKKMETIQGAKMPVSGMEIKDDVIYFQDTAVKDLSKAQSIIFWSKVFLSTNPGLKFMTLDDGESLDSGNMKVIQEFAEENDLLYIMTKVDESGSQGIVLEEGQVIRDNYKEQPEKGEA